MRTERTLLARLPLLTLAVLSMASPVCPQGGAGRSAADSSGGAAADTHDHTLSRLETARTAGFSAQEIERIDHLQRELMCKCPVENWSRTLDGCPDGCADEQKVRVRDMVQEGKSDQQILDWMVAAYGPQVLASPGWSGTGKWSYLLPIIVLGGASVAAGFVIASWLRAGGERRRWRIENTGDVTPEELERARRELKELE